MTRLLLIAATVMGLNAANVPNEIGSAISGLAGTGTDISASVANVANGLAGGIDVGNITQASVLGGFSGGAKPIFVSGGVSSKSATPVNVAKVRITKRTNRSSGLSF